MSRQFRVQTTQDPSPTDEMRWSCDGQDCVQNVLYDQFNPNAWLAAADTQAQCYAQAGEEKGNTCARFVCNPNIPYGCIQYDNELYDDYPNPDSFYMDSSQCTSTRECDAEKPSFYCDPTGTCVLGTDPSGGDQFNKFEDCTDKCRLFTCQMNDAKVPQSVCALTENYLDPGTSANECEISCNQTRWQCIDDERCVQNVMYGMDQWYDAYATEELCQSDCNPDNPNPRYSCSKDKSMCVSDASGKYYFSSSCYADPKNSCKQNWYCNGGASTGGCVVATSTTPDGTPLYGTKTECDAMTQCTQKFSCSTTTGYCMPSNAGKYGHTNCMAQCSKPSTNFKCDPISGTCYPSYMPLSVGTPTLDMSTCSANCTEAYYYVPSNVSPLMCAYTADPNSSYGAWPAQGCLEEIGYNEPNINPTPSPPGAIFCPREECASTGVEIDDGYFSKYLGYGIAIAKGTLAFNSLAATGFDNTNSVFDNHLLWYTLYAPQQGGISAYRLFETKSNNVIHSTYNEYASYIASQTQASVGASLGLFNMTAQINLETSQSIHVGVSFMSSNTTLAITNSIFDINIDLFEDWNALSDDVQSYVVQLADDDPNMTESSFDNAVGSHIVSRIWCGRQYMYSVSTTNTTKVSQQELQASGCLNMGYASIFSASVCNNTDMSLNSTFNTELVQTKQFVQGPSSMFGMLQNLKDEDMAMRFLMFQNASMDDDTGMKYEYMFIPYLLKNMARKMRDPYLHYKIAIAADKMIAYYTHGSAAIEDLWQQHAAGTLLAWDHQQWPEYYKGWEYALLEQANKTPAPPPRPLKPTNNNNNNRVRVQTDSTTWDCSNNMCIPSDDGSGSNTYFVCAEKCHAYQCNPLTSQCVQVPYGDFTNLLDCHNACAQNNPTMCSGDMCFAVGCIVAVAGNNLLMPSKPRRVFTVDFLSKSAEGSCVTGQDATGSPISTSSTYYSSGEYASSLSSNTSVDMSYSGGVTNVAFTGNVATSKNVSRDRNVQQTQTFAYVPRSAYGLNTPQEDRHCLSYPALDQDFVNQLLSLPYLSIDMSTSSRMDFTDMQITEHYNFINTVGSHIITQVNLGVALNSVDATSYTWDTSLNSVVVNACVSANGLAWNAKACTNVQSGENSASAATNVNNTRSIYGGDAYTRSMLSNPMTPLMMEYEDTLSRSSSAYAHPVPISSNPPFEYEAVWSRLLTMAVSDLANDTRHYRPMWDQLLVKAGELVIAYYSRWAIVDMQVSQSKPFPDTTTSKWVQVTVQGCGQLPNGSFDPFSNSMQVTSAPTSTLDFGSAGMSCIGGQSLANNGHGWYPYTSGQNYDTYSPITSTSMFAGDTQLTSTNCNTPATCGGYLWMNWKLIVFPQSPEPVVTSTFFQLVQHGPNAGVPYPPTSWYYGTPAKVITLGGYYTPYWEEDDDHGPFLGGAYFMAYYTAPATSVFTNQLNYAAGASLTPAFGPTSNASWAWLTAAPSDSPNVPAWSATCYADNGDVLSSNKWGTANEWGWVWSNEVYNDGLAVSVYYNSFTQAEVDDASGALTTIMGFWKKGVQYAPKYNGMYDAMPILLSLDPNFSTANPQVQRVTLSISGVSETAANDNFSASLEGDISMSLWGTYVPSFVDMIQIQGFNTDMGKKQASVMFILTSADGSSGLLVASNYQKYQVIDNTLPTYQTLTAIPLSLSMPVVPAVVSTMYVYSALDSSTSIVRFGSLGPALPYPDASYGEPQAISVYMTQYDVFNTPIYVYDYADPVTPYLTTSWLSEYSYGGDMTPIGTFYAASSSTVSPSIDTTQLTYCYLPTYTDPITKLPTYSLVQSSTTSTTCGNSTAWIQQVWNIPAYP